MFAGESGFVPLSLRADRDLTELVADLETPASRVDCLALRSLAPGVLTAEITPLGGDRSQLRFVLLGKATATQRPLADLAFHALPHTHSMLVPFTLGGVMGRAGARTIEATLASSGRVVVIGREPVLMGNSTPAPSLTLLGNSGVTYQIESTDQVPRGVWSLQGEPLTLDGTSITLPLNPTAAARFFRTLVP